MNYKDELYHYGKLGMKWGKRLSSVKSAITNAPANNKAYREKLRKSAITADRKVNLSDSQLLKYGAMSLPKKAAIEIGKQAVMGIATDIMIGRANYKYASKAQLLKKAAVVTKRAAISMAANEALAYNVSKRYSQEGKTVKKTKGLFTPEEKIQLGYRLATVALFYKKANDALKGPKPPGPTPQTTNLLKDHVGDFTFKKTGDNSYGL